MDIASVPTLDLNVLRSLFVPCTCLERGFFLSVATRRPCGSRCRVGQGESAERRKSRTSWQWDNPVCLCVLSKYSGTLLRLERNTCTCMQGIAACMSSLWGIPENTAREYQRIPHVNTREYRTWIPENTARWKFSSIARILYTCVTWHTNSLRWFSCGTFVCVRGDWLQGSASSRRGAVRCRQWKVRRLQKMRHMLNSSIQLRVRGDLAILRVSVKYMYICINICMHTHPYAYVHRYLGACFVRTHTFTHKYYSHTVLATYFP